MTELNYKICFVYCGEFCISPTGPSQIPCVPQPLLRPGICCGALTLHCVRPLPMFSSAVGSIPGLRQASGWHPYQ